MALWCLCKTCWINLDVSWSAFNAKITEFGCINVELILRSLEPAALAQVQLWKAVACHCWNEFVLLTILMLGPATDKPSAFWNSLHYGFPLGGPYCIADEVLRTCRNLPRKDQGRGNHFKPRSGTSRLIWFSVLRNLDKCQCCMNEGAKQSQYCINPLALHSGCAWEQLVQLEMCNIAN